MSVQIGRRRRSKWPAAPLGSGRAVASTEEAPAALRRAHPLSHGAARAGRGQLRARPGRPRGLRAPASADVHRRAAAGHALARLRGGGGGAGAAPHPVLPFNCPPFKSHAVDTHASAFKITHCLDAHASASSTTCEAITNACGSTAGGSIDPPAVTHTRQRLTHPLLTHTC